MGCGNIIPNHVHRSPPLFPRTSWVDFRGYLLVCLDVSTPAYSRRNVGAAQGNPSIYKNVNSISIHAGPGQQRILILIFFDSGFSNIVKHNDGLTTLVLRASRPNEQVKQLRLDKQVLEAHEAATSALKTCRETQGLTVERVEDTLDALAEVRRDEAGGEA